VVEEIVRTNMSYRLKFIIIGLDHMDSHNDRDSLLLSADDRFCYALCYRRIGVNIMRVPHVYRPIVIDGYLSGVGTRSGCNS